MSNLENELALNAEEIKAHFYRALSNVISDAQWALRNKGISGARSSESDIESAIVIMRSLKS